MSEEDRPYRDERPPMLTQSELEALRASVAHCTIEDIFKVEEGLDAEAHEDLAKYFNGFARPNKEVRGNPCLRCHEPLAGDLVSSLFSNGGFEWGLTHGHGHCKWCYWPATLYHFIKDRKGEDLATIRGVLLQVHPDFIEIRKKESVS